MKNEIEKLLEKEVFPRLISNKTILDFERDGLFYFLEIPQYPLTEILVDAQCGTINVVGKSKRFEITDFKNDFKKLMFSYILTDNTNHRIIENENFLGKWIFEIRSQYTKDNKPIGTGRFTYVAEIPICGVTVESLEKFLKSAVSTFLSTRSHLSFFCDATNITADMLGFTDSEFSDVEVFIDPEFERFLQHNFGKDNN